MTHETLLYHSLRELPLSDRDPDALASLCREGDQQIPHMIHISLLDRVVESQCWLVLFPGPVIEVVLAEDAGKDQVELCVCEVDPVNGSANPYACRERTYPTHILAPLEKVMRCLSNPGLSIHRSGT